eukprot:COSAG02_NODE_2181_length_9586_cov_3.262254_6_plen_187_part_00
MHARGSLIRGALRGCPGLSTLRSLFSNVVSAFRARENRTSADRLRMIRRRLLLVERSLHGGAAELQETELPSLALLRCVTLDPQSTAAGNNSIQSMTSFSTPGGNAGRRPLMPPELAPLRTAPLLGELSAPQVAERIWEAVDEGNRVVLIGRLFELSKHPDCFRGMATDAILVRKTSCLRYLLFAS